MLSVLMAAYNAARYLDEAIRSVLAQRGVAFELLVGDDGSTDGTWAVVSQYQGDPRVRAWRWAHRGAATVRNQLAARARGASLVLCDADDRLTPHYLCRLAEVAARDTGAGVIYADHRIIEGASRPPRTRAIRGPDHTWDLLWDHVPDGGSLIRRWLFRRLGGYRTDLPFMFDYDLFLRLAEVTRFRKAPAGVRYVRRRRSRSLSDRSYAEQQRLIVRIARAAIRRRYGYRVPW